MFVVVLGSLLNIRSIVYESFITVSSTVIMEAPIVLNSLSTSPYSNEQQLAKASIIIISIHKKNVTLYTAPIVVPRNCSRRRENFERS